MNSGTVLAGNEGLTSITPAVRERLATGGDVPDEIEAEVFIERCVDRVEGARHQKRMAVRRRAHDRLGGDIAAGAGAVLDNERLAEPFRQPLADQPCNNVDVVACGEPDNDVHWSRRIGLRPSETRNGWQRRSSRCQMQKLSARKFHFNPPITWRKARGR